MEKLLHPSFDVLRVDGSDLEAVEFAMIILHSIGWQTQQCGIERGLESAQYWHSKFPERFIQACAHGSAALHHILGRTVEEPWPDIPDHTQDICDSCDHSL